MGTSKGSGRTYSPPRLMRYGDMVKLTASGTVTGTENTGHPERKN